MAKAKSDAQRQSELRERFKAEGLSWASMWVHKSETKKARALVAELPATKRALAKAKG